MAGDWLKMRIDLQSHPKVVRIMSALRPQDVQFLTDKFRVIGGLHAMWGVFDTHSEDGVLHGYTLEMMDHIIGWAGFSKAVFDVEWLVLDEDGSLAMPSFEEHNGKSGKRRAEDQKRKRDSRLISASCPEDLGQIADKKQTETGLEKRREEKKEKTNIRLSADDVFPEIENRSLVMDWLAVRKEKKSALTQTALDGFLRETEKAGWTITDALRICCERGWAGFKASWVKDEKKPEDTSKPFDLQAWMKEKGAYNA